jgi:hypothetical protein
MLNCGQQWYLQRGLGLPQRPGWAMVGGSAVHAATEELDKLDDPPDNVRDVFNHFFDLQIEEELNRHDGKWSKEDFRASGRASRQWPDKENEAWWRANGPTFVGNWLIWRSRSPLELYRLDDGSRAIELEGTVTLGNLPVKVVIDRLFTSGQHGLVMVDLKSGANMPKDELQLAVYSLALRETLDLDVRWGLYWDARKGMSTATYDLEKWPKERVDYIFRSVRAMQEQDLFLPHPSNLCSACGVREYCDAVGGSLAHTVPPPWRRTDNV